MFGARLNPTEFSTPPAWAETFRVLYCPTATLLWKYQPKGKYTYGCCHIYGGCGYKAGTIELYTNETGEPGKWLRMVVLHELAHAMAGGREVVPGRKKPTGHGPKFWAIACALYEKEGLLEYAAEKEGYAGGRAAAKAMLAKKLVAA